MNAAPQFSPGPFGPADDPKNRIIQVQTSGTLKGLDLEISAAMDVRRLPAFVGYLEEIGFVAHPRPQPIELSPDGLPICPKHRVPMRRREKQGDEWHSHKVEGPGGEELYCKGYDSPDSPGWRVPLARP